MGISEDLQRLTDLHASGGLTDSEFEQAKAQALGEHPTPVDRPVAPRLQFVAQPVRPENSAFDDDDSSSAPAQPKGWSVEKTRRLTPWALPWWVRAVWWQAALTVAGVGIFIAFMCTIVGFSQGWLPFGNIVKPFVCANSNDKLVVAMDEYFPGRTSDDLYCQTPDGKKIDAHDGKYQLLSILFGSLILTGVGEAGYFGVRTVILRRAARDST